jgi:hypothetical protein
MSAKQMTLGLGADIAYPLFIPGFGSSLTLRPSLPHEGVSGPSRDLSPEGEEMRAKGDLTLRLTSKI